MNRLGLRRWVCWGFAGLPCLGLACAQFPVDSHTPSATPIVSPSPVVPSGDSAFNVRLSPEPVAYTAANKQPVPVSLDAVLRLAEENNPLIAVTRAKVCSAFAEKELAAAKWIPDVYIGVGYWRHEGGIQLQEGPLIKSSTGAFLFGPQVNATYNPREYTFRQLAAARKVWQSNGELTKISVEQLLDASSTYIDLLSAHAALAISRELEGRINEFLPKAKNLLKAAGDYKPVQLEVMHVESELGVQRQTQRKLQGQIDAASAKLAYLLGLGDNVQVLPADGQMAAFHIVDATAPTEALVAQALATGPGVRELEGILSVIQHGLQTATGAARWVPEVNLQVGEGAFGAGLGSNMNFSNRLDLGIQAKWNISDLFLAEHKKAVVHSQMNEAQWTYQELRSKLTLGVQEAKSSIESAGAQFHTAEEQIKRAKEAVKVTKTLAQAGIDADMVDRRVTYADVMLAHRAVSLAQLNYVEVIRDFDKAQLRLMVLVSPCNAQQLPMPAPTPK